MGRGRKGKLSQRRARLGRAAAALIAVVFLAAVATALLFRNPPLGGGPPEPPGRAGGTAAIVDQLSLTQPNPTFADRATELLQRAGYRVDYFPGEQVTVDFYRNLPSFGYDLIVLRVHAGITTEVGQITGKKTQTEYVSLFTSEPYSKTKYPEEQIGRLGASRYYGGGEEYFGIAPGFIEKSMRGRFDKTLIVMMGCDGLRSQRTARAFLDKGASAFVSWSKPVSASHTDAATERLLEHLLIEGLTVPDAVAQTRAEVGPDPSYGAELRVLESGG